MANVKQHPRKRKDGTRPWMVDYTDNTNKRVMKSGFKTRAEAENYLAKIRLELNKGTYVSLDKSLTFADIACDYINNHAELYCKPSTIGGYKAYLKNNLLPFFGVRKIGDIKPDDIKRYMRLEQSKGLSAKSINNYLILMGSIFKQAMLQGRAVQNPVSLVRKLKREKREMTCLTSEQVDTVLNYAKANYERLYPLLFTAIFTGLRRGELLALTWDDIDFGTNKIRVNKSLFKGKIGTPKSSNSVRKVNIPPKLSIVLKELKLKSTSKIVFANEAGKYLHPENMTRRWFKPCLKDCDITGVRFHDLRHTFASLLISNNVSPKYVQEQMGHASCQTTLDIYSHILPESIQGAIKTLDSVLKEEPKATYSKVASIKS